MSYEEFFGTSGFLSIILKMIDGVYVYLNRVQIAGLPLFTWLLAFFAISILISVIRVFASGGANVTGAALGASERLGQRKYDKAAAEHRKSYEYHKENLSRREEYNKRYYAEKKSGGK